MVWRLSAPETLVSLRRRSKSADMVEIECMVEMYAIMSENNLFLRDTLCNTALVRE